MVTCLVFGSKVMNDLCCAKINVKVHQLLVPSSLKPSQVNPFFWLAIFSPQAQKLPQLVAINIANDDR